MDAKQRRQVSNRSSAPMDITYIPMARGFVYLAVVLDWFSRAVIGVQIHLLIFYAAPQPLDEDVVPPSPFAVHADCNVVVGKHTVLAQSEEIRARYSKLFGV